MCFSVGSITSLFGNGTAALVFVLLAFFVLFFGVVACFCTTGFLVTFFFAAVFFVAVAVRFFGAAVVRFAFAEARVAVACFLREADCFTAFFWVDVAFFLATVFRLVVGAFLGGIEKK